MSLAKIAQHHAGKMPEEGQIVLVPHISIEEDDDFEPVIPLDFDEKEAEEEEHEHKHDDKCGHEKGEVVVKIDEDVDDDEVNLEGFAFLLPTVPGGMSQDEIEEEEDTNDLAVEDEDEDIKVEEVDEWDWEKNGGLKNFLSWLKLRLKAVLSHSGSDTSGLERAISYLESLDRIISKAVRKDIKNELDIGKIENAREEIRKGVVRLEDRLEKVNVNRYKKKKK